MKFLKKYWAFLFLFLLVSVLVFFNYQSGTFLSGWDNLHPEYDPLVNLERAWQASWQEYQGLGLLGGMAHAADFFRQLLLLPLHLLLPLSLSRYFWHFLMLFLGSFGAYRLIFFFIYDWQKKNKNLFQRQLVALLGASFYLLNFGTVQIFYTTFEPFASFFGFLPWLLLFLMQVLDADLKDNKKLFKKNLIKFALLSVLATAMAYVQTIFIVYVILLIPILFYYLFQSYQKSKKRGNKALRKSFFIAFLIFAINAFWFLPVIHFTFTGSDLVKFSKSKAMSNQELFLRNQDYGSFKYLAKLQGFWLGQSDFDSSGNGLYLMDTWKSHFSNPMVTALAWIFFFIALMALIELFKGKNKYRYLLLGLFIVSWWMLSAGSFPFAVLTKVLHILIPLFYEMFRITFTKWIIPFSLFYSIFFAFGINSIFSLLKKKVDFRLIAFLLFSSIVFYSLPSFRGNYFYQRLKVQVPDPYFELFDYFKNEAPASSRIANFPQYSFNGWQWNDWGYRGSGFLWYGIKQPILDRAFDVWSEADERYYWQIQYAVDKKDISLLENVLSQYDVDYLLLDQSVVNRNTNKPFNYQKWQEFFAESDRLSLEREFDFIKVYSFVDDENSREKEFVSFYNSLPSVGSDYRYSWLDQIYLDNGDYLLREDSGNIYPFTSLFSNHSQDELEFMIEEDQEFLFLKSNLSNNLFSRENLNLLYANYFNAENYLPMKVSWQTVGVQTSFYLESLLPEVIWRDEIYSWDINKSFILDSSLCQESNNCFFLINNEQIAPFSKNGQTAYLFSNKKTNTVSLANDSGVEYYDYRKLDFSLFELKEKQSPASYNEGFLVRIPKIENQIFGQNILNTDLNRDEEKNCDSYLNGSFFKEIKETAEGKINLYTARRSKSCDSFLLDGLAHNQSYLLRINSLNQSSLPFLFAIQAQSIGRSPIETHLSDESSWQDNYLILPAIEDFNFDYKLYFSTDSFGQETNQNLLSHFSIHYWPFNFIKSLRLIDQKNHEKTQLSDCDFEVNKKALWLYKVKLNGDSCQNNYLKLSQAYSDDWLAISNGKILDHYKVNNWANLWDSGDGEQVWIFFWPQLLEYFGFLLLLAILIALKKY